MAAPTPSDSPAPAPVHDITQTRRDDRLRDEFDLVRERRPVYVLDVKEAKKKAGSAERMAKMRAKQAEQGLKTIPVPVVVADAVKAAGGWDTWLKAQQQPAPSAPPAPVPEAPKGPQVPVEILDAVKEAGGWDQWIKKLQAAAPTPQAPVPKPAVTPDKSPQRRQLNPEEKRMMEIGFSVLKLTGWRRRLADWLIGS